MHGGRLEVYVNGTKVYDRKEAVGAADFYPSLDRQSPLDQFGYARRSA